MSEPTVVSLPDQPCVVIYDGGGQVVIATDSVCEPIAQWARWAGPISRPVMVARLRAIADQIDRVDSGDDA